MAGSTPSDTLRHEYRAAAEELRALGKPVTPRSLSTHLAKNHHAVRGFFAQERNREFATQIGVRINPRHHVRDFLAVKERLIEEGIEPTARAIAEKLGIDRSTVYKAIRKIKPPTPRKTRPRKTVRKAKKADSPKPKPKKVAEAPRAYEEPSGRTQQERISFRSFKPMMRNVPLPAPEPIPPDPNEPSWRTSLRTSGELTLTYYDSGVLRLVLGKVDPKEYVRLWDAGKLGFQVKGQPKPDHLPSREDISVFC